MKRVKTLLVKNNAGKSNIIKAIDLVLGDSKCELSGDSTVTAAFEEKNIVEPSSSNGLGLKVFDKIDLSKFERPKKEIVKGKENICIIDTNVFVDHPDIISKIDQKCSVVLSVKLIDELDYLRISLTEEQKRNLQ